MKEKFAQEIIGELSDERSMMSRKGVAEAVTSPSGEVEKELHETAQENYFVEKFTWDENSDSCRVTAIREDGEEMYVLKEVNGQGGYEAELSVSADGIYSESINSKGDFDDLLGSLEGSEEISFERRLDENYSVGSGYGRESQT